MDRLAFRNRLARRSTASFLWLLGCAWQNPSHRDLTVTPAMWKHACTSICIHVGRTRRREILPNPKISWCVPPIGPKIGEGEEDPRQSMCIIAGHATRLEHHDFRSVRDEDKRSTVSSLAAVPITVGFRWVGRQFASSRSSEWSCWNRKTQVRTTVKALPATLSPTDRDFGSLRARALLNYGGFLRCRIKVLYRMRI